MLSFNRMRHKRSIFLTILAVGLAIPMAKPGAVTAANHHFLPNAPAAEIRAAHVAAATEELRLTYVKRMEPHPSSDEIDAPTSQTLIVGLGPDYFHVTTDAGRRIYDFSLRRVIHANMATHEFTHRSLYAEVYFKHAEMGNRLFLRRAMQQLMGDEAEVNASKFEPVWLESELGVAVPGLPQPEIAWHIDDEKRHRFTYGDEQLATIVPYAPGYPEKYAPMFARFLCHATRLHPQIVNAIDQAHILPATLVYQQVAFQDERVLATYELQSVETTVADYPLPADFEARMLLAGDGPSFLNSIAAVLDVMIAAAHGEHGGGPPTEESYFKRIAAAFDREDDLSVIMLFAAWEFQINDRRGRCPMLFEEETVCEIARRVTWNSRFDDGVAQLLEARELETRSLPADAADALRSIDRDGIEAAYMLDLLIADYEHRAASGRSGRAQNGNLATLDRLVRVIRRNPYIRDAYPSGWYNPAGELAP